MVSNKFFEIGTKEGEDGSVKSVVQNGEDEGF